MPQAQRQRVIGATPADVWRTAGDPRHMARWWPKARRMEAVDERGFTQVLQTEKGRDVRADFVVTVIEPIHELRFQQELIGTPFDGLLSHAETAVMLSENAPGATTVTISMTRKLRGLARFGGVIMRRGMARQLDEALDNLAALFPPLDAGGA